MRLGIRSFGVMLLAAQLSCEPSDATRDSTAQQPEPKKEARVMKSDEEWRALLTPEQYQITRMKGTERAFTGAYWDFKEHGVYTCVGCGQELFRSDTKFDSGSGWPSFWTPASNNNVSLHTDVSHGMQRTEVLCSRCDAHLGHLFNDGPQPTGQRFCINSASLRFRKSD